MCRWLEASVRPLRYLRKGNGEGLHKILTAPNNDNGSEKVRRVLGIGEAVTPDQALEPQKIGPGILLLSIPAPEDQTGGFLTAMQDRVEGGDKFHLATNSSNRQLEGFDPGRSVEDLESVPGFVTRHERRSSGVGRRNDMERAPHGMCSLWFKSDSPSRNYAGMSWSFRDEGECGPSTRWDAELCSTRLCRTKLVMSAFPGRGLSQEVLVFRSTRKHNLDICCKKKV